MPKTEFLQIRITPEDRERFRRAAEAEYLDVSTWARRVLMLATDRWEGKSTAAKKVAEPAPDAADRERSRRRK